MSPEVAADVRKVLSEGFAWVEVTESVHRLYMPAAFPNMARQIDCEARLSAHLQRHGLAVLHAQPQNGYLTLMLAPPSRS